MVDGITQTSNADQQVTASALVRNFGVWQERASRAPVYILHHGRPRLMLVSVEMMDALFAGSRSDAAAAAGSDASSVVIDAIDQPIMIVGRDGRITLANHAARARFGEAVAPGAEPATLSRINGDFLSDSIARVLSTGATESTEIVPDRYPERRMRCTVAPLPDGCMIRTDDATAADLLRTSEGAREALVVALEATRSAAVARVSLRGYLIEPGAALAALTAVAPEQLATARFQTLVDVADRPRVSEAIEDAIRTVSVRAAEARLLVRGADALAVRIGFSPALVNGRVEEILAVIAVNGPSHLLPA
jgi:hypothetical protein